MHIALSLPLLVSLFAVLTACADRSCSASATDDTACTALALQYTNAPSQPEPARIVPVHVDAGFNLYERTKIVRAINEWNHALNGYMRIEVATRPTADAPRSGGWVIAKIESGNPVVGHPAMKRALAITVGTRNAIVYVVADRIGGRDLGGIMMHEFGHALGAGHDSGSALMHPYYTGDKQRCIDKGAVRAIAAAQNLPLDNLNWCASGRGDG